MWRSASLAGEVGEDCDVVINCVLTMVAGFGHVLLAARWHGGYTEETSTRAGMISLLARLNVCVMSACGIFRF